MRRDLTNEALVIAVVIAECGHDGAVGREGQGVERRPFVLVTAHELGDQMLRQGGTAAVACNQETAPGQQVLGQHAGPGRDVVELSFECADRGT